MSLCSPLACAYVQSDQSLCLLLEYSINVKLLTEHNLEFLSLKRGCTVSAESTLVKMLEITCCGLTSSPYENDLNEKMYAEVFTWNYDAFQLILETGE